MNVTYQYKSYNFNMFIIPPQWGHNDSKSPLLAATGGRAQRVSVMQHDIPATPTPWSDCRTNTCAASPYGYSRWSGVWLAFSNANITFMMTMIWDHLGPRMKAHNSQDGFGSFSGGTHRAITATPSPPPKDILAALHRGGLMLAEPPAARVYTPSILSIHP